MALTLDTGEDMARQEWHRGSWGTGVKVGSLGQGRGAGEPTPTLTHTSIYKYSGWMGRGSRAAGGLLVNKEVTGGAGGGRPRPPCRRHDPPIKLS
ncbi:hypothetical protein E2C01_036400 [Portunus trituberculatus]|uniref:Uncharacterized protein n=1 Tax=Portunus trituberculatus TaxID=210409 RepID=A0A5B7FB27_PORTR|nr:hypothetical protein [Portunus trituberculatus]